jgi:ankyrin repeat protein
MSEAVPADKQEPDKPQADIFLAARNNDLAELKLALEQGQRLDATLHENGHTPLHTAALWGNASFIIAALSHATANPWSRSLSGLLPYDIAADRRDLHVMKLFFDAMYPDGQFPLTDDP